MDNLDFVGEVTSYGVHKIYSYPARFIPQLPEYFIKKYDPDVVCDCFGGSGTTAVVAKRLDKPSVHMDIMPVSLALARVKTHYFSLLLFHRMMRNVEKGLNDMDIRPLPDHMVRKLTHKEDEEYFFDVPIARQIYSVSKFIYTLQLTHEARMFLKLCAAQVMRRCSNADTKGFEWHRSKSPSPNKDYIGEFRKKCYSTRDHFMEYYEKYPNFRENDITPYIINTTKRHALPPFDMIVTSPPYGKLTVVNYPEIHKFSHDFFFSNEPAPAPSNFVQTTPQLYMYFSKIIPKLRKGGHAIIVVAPSSTDNWVVDTITIMENIGLTLHDKGERKIGNKASARGIRTEWVLDFVK